MKLVILYRAPAKENVTYEHKDMKGAARRAYTLADLHHCQVTIDAELGIFHVHAAATYNRKRETP